MGRGIGNGVARLLAASLAIACTRQPPDRPPVDGFDRGPLLQSLAQNVYLPAYRDLSTQAQSLKEAAVAHASAQGAGAAERAQAQAAFHSVMTRAQEAELYQVGPA